MLSSSKKAVTEVTAKDLDKARLAKQKKPKKTKEKAVRKVSKTVQDTIPYEHAHGKYIFEVEKNRYSVTYCLINAGVDVVAVSGDLGHAQVSTTINIPYGHTPQSSHNSIKSKTVLLLFIVIRNSFSFLNCP